MSSEIQKKDDVVLRVKNVSKRFEMYSKPRHRLQQMLFGHWKTYCKEFWALKDINFEVKRGECVGVIGKNGAGKSTLLQILVGTLQPTTGTVEIKGRVAALLELGSGFNPEFTGKENVYLNASILGLTKKEIDEKYQEIVDFADIGEFIDQPVKTYSSGMMVRLAFAVQVMVEPDILIVDEALSVGDAAFQQKCLYRMKNLLQKGITILLVSHNTELVREFARTALWLNNHRIESYGRTPEILKHFAISMHGTKYKSPAKLSNSNLEHNIFEEPFFSVPVAGTGDVVITDAVLVNENNNLISHIVWNSEIRLRFVLKIKTKKEVKNPGIWIGLDNERGLRIFTLNSYFNKELLKPWSKGISYTYMTEFSFPMIAEGSYSFAISISDGNPHLYNILSMVVGVNPIHVDGEGAKTTQGIVIIEKQKFCEQDIL